MKRITMIIMLVMSIVTSLLFMGCVTEAEMASWNTSQAADQFEVYRRVVFYNGITDQYILTIEGYCSIEKGEDGMLRVMVKTDDGKYLKHHLGLSDNVTFFSEQMQAKNVSKNHYRVIFRPSSIIPNVDIQ